MSQGWTGRHPAEQRKGEPDAELDAAIVRVPYWRAFGLAVGFVALLVPAVWYLVAVRGSERPGAEIDWLDGSEWRVVEIDGRLMPKEATARFGGGALTIAAEGCAPRSIGYRLTRDGIVLVPQAGSQAPSPCGHATVDQAWERFSRVRGLTRYGTGLALTDRDGRGLVRMRR